MIPYSITVQRAAAPTQSLEFLFWGAGLIVLPVVLIYTAGLSVLAKRHFANVRLWHLADIPNAPPNVRFRG
jgi:hypothetical protein